MRPRLAVIAFLAVSLVASVAFAAQDKVNVTFESFSASGVTGVATLDPMPNGEVQIHAAIRGLEPGVEYVALIYDQSLTCGDGTSSFTIVQFEANPAGVATWNERVAKTLPEIESIGLRVLSTNALVSCATVQ